MALPPPRLVALTVLAIARVAWAADATCPTPAAIAAELQRLPGGGASTALDRSEVNVSGRTMRVVLRDGSGQVLGVREVAAPRDCRQRAAVAAVVLAAWAHAWEDVTVAPTAPSAPQAPPAHRRAEVGLQAVGHHDGRAPAVGGALLAGLQGAGPFGAAVLVDFATTRDQTLGPGAVGYSFVRLGAGVVYRVGADAPWMDAGIYPQVVRLAVTPDRLAGAHAVALWAAAVEARVRVGWRWGRLLPFVSAGAGRRLVRERLTLDDNPATADLSPWNLELGVGVALRLGALDAP